MRLRGWNQQSSFAQFPNEEVITDAGIGLWLYAEIDAKRVILQSWELHSTGVTEADSKVAESAQVKIISCISCSYQDAEAISIAVNLTR